MHNAADCRESWYEAKNSRGQLSHHGRCEGAGGGFPWRRNKKSFGVRYNLWDLCSLEGKNLDNPDSKALV